MANKQAKLLVSSVVLNSLKKATRNDGSGFLTWRESHPAKTLIFHFGSTAAQNMAIKRPLCLYDGYPRELAAEDTLPGSIIVSREVPSGTMDGVNTNFGLAYLALSNTEQVYLNGMLQNQGEGKDYRRIDVMSENSHTHIFFEVAPRATDILLVTYWR